MKRLICAKDVEAVKDKGEKVLYIDKNTLITPSAKDVARACGIEFTEEMPICNPIQNSCDQGLDSELIYKAFKVLMDKGLLNQLLDSISLKPYVAETGSNGFKLVRGDSVKYDPFDTKKANLKVFHQEVITEKESSTSAGFFTFDHSEFTKETSCEETIYVIEGVLTIAIDGRTLTASPSDVLYIPSGTRITIGSSDKAKVFYSSCSTKREG